MTTTPTASPELPDLDACPFCGGTEAFVERADYSAAFVVCDSRVDEHSVCMARGPIGIQDDDGEEIPGQAAAIREWNKAAALARRAQPEGEAPQAELSQVAALLYSALNDAYQASMFDGEELKRVVRALSAYNRYRSSPAASLSPLCGAQHAESGKEAAAAMRVIGGQRWSKEAEMTEGWLAAQQAAAPGALADNLRRTLNNIKDATRLADVRSLANLGLGFLDAALSAPGTPEAPFQARVEPWMAACFGPRISADTAERNHRFIEEALELVQAGGMPKADVLQLVDYTYGRAIGELHQEVGGVMVTLAALCLAQGLDMHQAAEIELARIWTKVEAIREKQRTKPRGSPLPMNQRAAQLDGGQGEGK